MKLDFLLTELNFATVREQFRLFLHQKDFRKKVVSWFKINGLMAGFSLLIACVLYFTIRDTLSIRYTLSIPVEFDDASTQNAALMAISPKEVNVTFRVSNSDLRNLERTKPHWIIEAPKSLTDQTISIGEKSIVRLKNGQLKGTYNLPIIDVEPSTVEISYDRKDEREFTIAPPRIEGEAEYGHAEIDFEPKTAKVCGGRMQLDDLYKNGNMLELPPVTLHGKKYGDHKEMLKILPLAGNQALKATPSEVTVTLRIVRDELSRVYSNMPVRIAISNGISLPAGYSIVPNNVTVSISGWDEALKEVKSSVIGVYAELSTQPNIPEEPGQSVTNKLQIKVMAPHAIAIWKVSAQPDTVNLVLTNAAPPIIVSTNTVTPVSDMAKNDGR